MPARVDDDARVTVEQPEARVVLRHDDGPADVHAARHDVDAPIGERGLDEAVPAGDTVRSGAVRAQETVVTQGVQRRVTIPGGGRLTQLPRRFRDVRQRGQVDVVLAEVFDVAAPTAQHRGDARDLFVRRRRREGQREIAAGFAEPVMRREAHDLRVVEPGDEVAQHRTGLDGCELIGVADEEQARRRLERFEQARRHRERQHRRLVDDDEIVGQGVARVVHEALRVRAIPPEQAMQGDGVGGRVGADAVLTQRLRHARRRLAGGSRERKA